MKLTSVLATALAACGTAHTPLQDAGAGPVPFGDAGLAACDHYFAAQYSRCGGPILPASETSRIRARFEQVCQNQVSLPGSGMTVERIEACASALDSAACAFPAGPPVACDFWG